MIPTALILGVGGQDGAYLAQLLLSKGYVVHGTSRDDQARRFDGLERLDIRQRVVTHTIAPNDPNRLLALLLALRPLEIYNLSGQSSVGLSFNQPADTFQSIAQATINILECIRIVDKEIRFFNACSSECFGNTSAPATETTPFQPRSPYAVAKAAAYWIVANYREAYGLHASSGILFNHESPLRPAHFVTRKIVAAAIRISQGSRERLTLGNLSIARDWGWAPDYVGAMWRMLQQPESDDFVIATGQTHSLAEFIELAFSEVKLDWHQHIDTDPKLFRPTDIERSAADPEKAWRSLGWRSRMVFEDIVRALVADEVRRSDGIPVLHESVPSSSRTDTQS
ncbi:MAG: GDP-mannose 4,6-dehydratase [Rhodospirillales bacterium]|nr:GDP-mannose 4,6-dehydratase [Rhodospirillales bacterium]